MNKTKLFQIIIDFKTEISPTECFGDQCRVDKPSQKFQDYLKLRLKRKI